MTRQFVRKREHGYSLHLQKQENYIIGRCAVADKQVGNKCDRRNSPDLRDHSCGSTQWQMKIFNYSCCCFQCSSFNVPTFHGKRRKIPPSTDVKFSTKSTMRLIAMQQLSEKNASSLPIIYPFNHTCSFPKCLFRFAKM